MIPYDSRRSAGWKPALQQVGNLRYEGGCCTPKSWHVLLFKGSSVVRRFGTWSLVLFGILQFGVSGFAQPLSNLVFTIGTTIRDGGSRDWSYLFLSSPEPRLLAGKRFAVYSKPGYPTNAGTFALRGAVFQQTDVSAINTLLNQSVALGQNLTALDDALLVLLRNVPGITNQSVAQRVATAFQIAAGHEPTAQTLGLLGNFHPGLQLCAGHGFSEQLGAATTYEVREALPGGNAGDVVGRVTIVPSAPVVLPAPGRPFQVVTNDSIDHLRVRLRWGTPAELRRVSLLNFGFNIWRIPRAIAEANNFHVTPPTLAALYSNPDFRRANSTPVMAPIDYSAGIGPGAADDPADRTTYFFSDDGRASLTNFTDGQEFYHFVTARDLLGRDGLVSPGRLTRACRRIPPQPPTDVRVVNTIPSGAPDQQRLQVEWTQNTNVADRVTQYWIYRWSNPAMIFTNEATPLSNRIAIVPHTPAAKINVFVDSTAGAFTTPSSSNIWYTVRAVSEAACDPLLSSHAGPAWGVLRQRAGPDATSGTVLGSCGTPAVIFAGQRINPIEPDPERWHLRFTCQRRDPGIAWVKFVVFNTPPGGETSAEIIGPIYFPPEGDRAEMDYAIPARDAVNPPQTGVSCTVGTVYDQVSDAGISFTVPVPSGIQKEIVFSAGQLLGTALSSRDPLLAIYGGLGSCRLASSAIPDASGMVAVRLNFAPGTTAFIQAQTNGVWSDIGFVTSDADGVFWVRYPACLIGPVPPFQGCLINLPNDSDCVQHVSTSASNRAPVRVRFRLTPRAREYRVYRRANDGPMLLISQGAAAFDPANTNKLMETLDDAMPPSGARLCYFVQLLDEHGNGSPMALIGCKEAKAEKLPRPVLAEPRMAGNTNNPQVVLSWFCPTAGVSRFQVLVKRVDPPKAFVDTGMFAAKLRPLPGYEKQTSYLGIRLRGDTGRFLAVHSQPVQTFDEVKVTPLIGPEFGPGPQFTLTANVLLNATYQFSVRAMDDQGPGDASEAWTFRWTPAFTPGNVPWPARPLPPVVDFDSPANPSHNDEFYPRVKALSKDIFSSVDYRYPVRVRIAQLDDSLEPQSNVGTANYVRYFAGSTSANPDPNVGVFSAITPDASRAGQRLLPIVIYRQQVTNGHFPRVSGDIVQVTPLIERIPWTINGNGDVTIPDRLFAGQIDNDYRFYLYVRDLQPVLEGAAYRYFVVRFNDKREMVEIIPAGEVTIPVES